MQTIDRHGYMLWVSGILLDFRNGKDIVAPQLDCEAVDKALENGEKIAFTTGGKIVSYAQLENGVIIEKLI
jgi:hypothetical protein